MHIHHPGRARFFASSPSVVIPVALWAADPQALDAHEDGDESMDSAIEDDDLERVSEGVANAANAAQGDGIRRKAMGVKKQWRQAARCKPFGATIEKEQRVTFPI